MSPPPDATVPSEDFNNGGSVPEAQSENSDVNSDTNAGPPKRTAWNRPSNGVLEAGSVMGGAVSWPALSESTKPVPRSSPDVSRLMGDGSTTSSQAPAASHSSQRQASTNSQVNSGPNHLRQRSKNRNGVAGGGGNAGGSSSGNGPPHNNINRPLHPVPPFSTIVVPYQLVQPPLETSVSGIRPVRGFLGSQSHSGNENSSNRNASRRANYSPRPHSEGQYHNNHGGRRDQDRRDFHVVSPYIAPMRFMPPPMPPAAGPFIPAPPPPPPMTIFPPMGFDMSSTMMYPPTMPPESFGPVPMMPPPFPFYIPPSTESSLTGMIVNQIDYYFSDDNLIKDNFLRANMDDNGWVPITLIASFRRVQSLTKDIPTILESLRYSTVVEVQGEKLRRRNDWNKWLFSGQPTNDRRTSSEDALVASVHALSLHPAGEEGMPREGSSDTHSLSDGAPFRAESVTGDNSTAA